MGKALLLLLQAVAVDGDTITAGGTAVRLWGVDAPEDETTAGRRAAGHMRQLVQGAELTCRIKDVDDYDRIVAPVLQRAGQGPRLHDGAGRARGRLASVLGRALRGMRAVGAQGAGPQGIEPQGRRAGFVQP